MCTFPLPLLTTIVDISELFALAAAAKRVTVEGAAEIATCPAVVVVEVRVHALSVARGKTAITITASCGTAVM